MDPEAAKLSKKLKVVFIGAIILFLTAFSYFDFFGDLLNIYTLIGKFGFLLLAYFTLLIYQNIIKAKKVGELILLTIGVFLVVGLNAHDDLKRYNDHVCVERFGKEFNQRRQSLGIPSIPTDWGIKRTGGRSAEWQKKDSVGHYWKLTIIDSTCTLEFERDEYNLKRTHNVPRSISIVSTLARGKGSDTIRYHYDVGDSIKTITRQQANSIFAAEKIQKDY